MTAFADGLQDLTQLLNLFGESGVSSFYLDNFNLNSIDFDMLLHTIVMSKINFSGLNYDAFLELCKDPEFLTVLGIEAQAPRRAVCGTRGSLRTMHGGGSAPSCCAFTHRVAFEEVSGHRVLITQYSGPGSVSG